MTDDQELVKRLQRRLRNWDPNGPCEVHTGWTVGSYRSPPTLRLCEYDEQGRLIGLHLCKSKLPEVPSEVWQFLALQAIHLDDNQLSALPAELGNLTSLRGLSLNNNQLSTLPAEVGNLTSLNSLYLGNNQLSTLPAEVGNLTSLNSLILRDNRLSTLPAELGNLTLLRYLYLDNNQLNMLPVELGNLTSLNVLGLGNNPLQMLPPEVRKHGTSVILAYLRNLQQADIERLEAKVTPAGEGDTSLPVPTKTISSNEISKEKSSASIKETVPVKIFYCYAHEDKDLRDRIDSHLGVLKRLGHVVGWYDREIQAGTEWEREIEEHLSTASIILLLVSADFVNSDYCYGVEMKKALELHQTGQARVLPILLRPFDWRDAPFAMLQMLPTGAKPITTWNNLDEALDDVGRGIRDVVSSLLSQKR